MGESHSSMPGNMPGNEEDGEVFVKSTIFTLSLLLYATLNVAAQTYFPPTDGSKWESVAPSQLEWCTENIDSLYEYLERNSTKAFIVLKDGRIALEWYADDFEADDNWYWASAGKTVTAALVGIAQAEGKLTIESPTSDHLGEGWTSLEAEQESEITVRHQLTMTSGLDDKSGDKDCTDPECLEFKADPGTRWAYHNAAYTLLGSVVESASGMGLNVFYSTRLATITGMNGGYIKIGFNRVLFSTARSMARFGLLALNDFVWDGSPVIDDEEYVRALTKPSQELNRSYGYLWWLNGQETFMLPSLQFVFPGPLTPNAPPDTYNGLGKNDQIVSVVPSEGLVIVRMGDAASPEGPPVPTTFVNEMWGLLRQVICTTTSVPSAGAIVTKQLTVTESNGVVTVHDGKGPYLVVDILGRVVARSASNQLDVELAGFYIAVDAATGASATFRK